MNIRRGQHTIEFAVLIAVVVAAILVGGVYLQRSIQAKLKLVEGQINEPPQVNATWKKPGCLSQGAGCHGAGALSSCCEGLVCIAEGTCQPCVDWSTCEQGAEGAYCCEGGTCTYTIVGEVPNEYPPRPEYGYRCL